MPRRPGFEGSGNCDDHVVVDDVGGKSGVLDDERKSRVDGPVVVAAQFTGCPSAVEAPGTHDADEFGSAGAVFGEEMVEAGDELGDGDGCRRPGWLLWVGLHGLANPSAGQGLSGDGGSEESAGCGAAFGVRL